MVNSGHVCCINMKCHHRSLQDIFRHFSTCFDRTSQLFELPTIFGEGHLFYYLPHDWINTETSGTFEGTKEKTKTEKNGYEFASIRITSLIQMAILYGATTSTPNEVIGIPENPFMTRFGRFNNGWGPGHQHIVFLCVCVRRFAFPLPRHFKLRNVASLGSILSKGQGYDTRPGWGTMYAIHTRAILYYEDTYSMQRSFFVSGIV